MIEMKLGQIVGAADSIAQIMATKLPLKAAIKLSKIGKAVSAELAAYNDARNKLILDLGTLNAQGQPEIKATDAAYPEFLKQMNDALDEEIRLDFEPMKIEEFGEKAEVSASDLILCEKFITT